MNKVFFVHIDWNLLIPVVILMIMGLTTLLSINGDLFRNQLISAVFSLFLFFIFTNVDYKLLQPFTLPLYIISIVLLIVVLVIGFESRGAVRWIQIFGVSLQFSEILKPFFILSFAAVLSKISRHSLKQFFSLLLFIMPVVFLIIIQPDLGSGLIYAGVVFFTLVAFGFPWKWFLAGGVAFVASMPIFWHILHDYQRKRLITFVNPTSDPLGISYNAIQSMIAVGSGGFFGKGLGEGTQSSLRFLPERHTDFIFATLSENLGFIGIAILFIAFFFLLHRIYTIYSETDDLFYRLIAMCAFFLFLLQFFVNAGMNMGIIPVVGVTLPFVSYGGSSLLSNCIILGMLSSISKNRKHVHTLEIR